MAETWVRGGGAIAFGVGGLLLGRWLSGDEGGLPAAALYVALPGALGALGAVAAPYLSLRPAAWALQRWKALPPAQAAAAVLGLILGLIVAALLTPALTALPGHTGEALPLAAALAFGAAGLALGLSRGATLPADLALTARQPVTSRLPIDAERMVLDTSVIIDGRIADVCETGFIHGTLLVPRFILDELRYIADSADATRRMRGRRGLDVLARLQKNDRVPVEIIDVDLPAGGDVDAKLLRMGASYGCPIVTNDFNLERVADVEGVQVLNMNRLASAVKSVLLPGEEMAIRIIQEGKEVGQGVGYLEDGTMVVVEGARGFINGDLDIVVTRILQTTGGRMIFAQPKAGGVRTHEQN